MDRHICFAADETLRPTLLFGIFGQSICPNSDFNTEVVALLRDKPQVLTKAMGFPTNWQEEPLWKGCSSPS